MGASLLSKLADFITKEFFLAFVYAILATIMAGVLWCLFAYVFPNKDLLSQLTAELHHSTKLVLAFFFALSVACIYLYRLLGSALTSVIPK